MKNYKHIFIYALIILFSIITFSCSSNPSSSDSVETTSSNSITTSSIINSEKEDIDMSDQNAIVMKMNGVDVHATLNDTLTAQEFKKLLPYTVIVSRAVDDLCGSVSETLASNQEEASHGWKIGEIGWFDGWFTILVDNEEKFSSYNFMIIGSVDEKDLDYVKSLTGRITIEIDFAKPTIEGNTMNITVNDTILTVDLVDNSSVTALKNLLKDGPLTIDMRDYANMEKVGGLGTSLPRNDEYITTEAGDVILYQGSMLVIYYAPNSWDFTRIGKIRNVTAQSLKQILGDGNVTISLSI